MDKVLREATPPTKAGAAISLSAARNEFEPFQVVVRPDAAATVTVTMTPFTGPGTLDRVELRRVGYVKIAQPSDPGSILSREMPDPLEPMKFGAAESLAGGRNQPYWITAYVPPDAKPGDYTATLTISVGAAKQDVPVKLHVFDFALPPQIGFDGNWNGSFEALGGGESLAKVKALKNFFFEHRLRRRASRGPRGSTTTAGSSTTARTGKFVDQRRATTSCRRSARSTSTARAGTARASPRSR